MIPRSSHTYTPGDSTMEATAVGPNKTAAALVPKQVEKMLDAVTEFSPPMPINTLPLDMERQHYIAEAESVGSVPEPLEKGAEMASPAMELFFDKLGERMAFERGGTRLYDALISKCLALTNVENGASGNGAPKRARNGGKTEPSAYGIETLRKIRAEEQSHLLLLWKCVENLGGDPTAQTPCADVTATASMGLMQVVTDPRTTFAQCLSAILTAELTDNAGWELLADLATQAGQPEMSEQFTAALQTEAEHLATIRNWLQSLLAEAAGTPAV
jgi:hypothetical protein